MPYGLYTKEQYKNLLISHGDYILFCLNESYTAIGLKQGYLEPGFTCNGSMPLLKKVIALPFEMVVLTDSYISVSGVTIPAATSYFDSESRPLAVFPRGKYQKDCYWVMGDHNITHSWDSRYWGCISKNQIITNVKPLLTW